MRTNFETSHEDENVHIYFDVTSTVKLNEIITFKKKYMHTVYCENKTQKNLVKILGSCEYISVVTLYYLTVVDYIWA